jgi:hypothetical protein
VDEAYAGGQGMKKLKTTMTVYEVHLCRPKTTIRVFIEPVAFVNPYWSKFERDNIYEFAFVDGDVSVEHSPNCYVSFSKEDFDKWFVVEDKA